MIPSNPARGIDQIERWMQAALMHPVGVVEGIDSSEARQHIDIGPAEVERVLTRSRALTALERLAIYSNAYYARLLECLREEFPILMHALGQETFDAFAVGYLQKYPSRSYTLIELGSNFPRYLAETRPDVNEDDNLPGDWPEFLIDLATLELTFNVVFDGPGVEGKRLFNPAKLKGIPAERLPEARLTGVSCLHLLALHYPVHSYFTAVRQEKDPAPPAPAETFLAITRRRYIVRHYELSRPAYFLLKALLAGETVGQAIVQAAAEAGPDIDHLANNLQQWFRDWTAEGFFAAVELKRDRS